MSEKEKLVKSSYFWSPRRDHIRAILLRTGNIGYNNEPYVISR